MAPGAAILGGSKNCYNLKVQRSSSSEMFGRFSRLRHLPYLSFSVALLLVVYGIGYHYIGYHYPHSLTNQLVKDWADAKEGGGLMGEHGLSLGAAEALKEKYDPLPILERSSGSSSHVESFAEPGFGHGSLEQDSLLNGSEQDIRDSVEGTDALSIAHKSVSKIDVGRGNRSMADLTLDGETGDHSGLRLSLKDISIPSTTSTSAQKQTGDSGRTAGDVTSKHEEWKRRMRVRLLNADSHWNFSLPWANAYNASFTKSSKWFRLLLYYTQTFDPSEPVITVCADTSFIDGLINWLISALVLQKHPPKNILIVTNEAKVCWFLSVHKVPVRCLKLFSESVLSEEGMKQVKKRKLTRLLVIRMSVMRILNHLGYDVLNMDADAIMLKNIIPVLELNRDSDIVGTIGGGLPKSLFHKWGVVVCMGAILIRSTPATGIWRGVGGAWTLTCSFNHDKLCT